MELEESLQPPSWKDPAYTRKKLPFRRKINISDLRLYSPELYDVSREISFSRLNDKIIMKVDLSGIKVYAVAQ